eukprot:CAMPEP_0176009548 /NCGR_PEP_ID=MMETSP0120_2-20121206/4307_1 /TAXON_ID=160619 /ORGANISM="Kryptoperidinium foliaceum, Strain CCMP 1326" /LENGTH=297 /DNA_ID=CAMNT_0017342347 /DNA_START=58 /DNA_END=948 /DNA_ORIENTATION=-
MSSDGDSSKDPPSDALMQLWSPDGYYTYLGVAKTETLDEDAIKKSYRKLSLKHHPDRSGGDAETFRVLNRAQKVLTNPKLRQQYDILGLDLDDDDEHAAGNSDDNNNGDGESSEETTSQGIVHEMASMALTAVLQMVVRTVMMAFVSLLVARYLWTLLPAMLFLAVVAFKIYSVTGVGSVEMLSPFIIGTGIILMYQSYDAPGWFLYWIGESMVIGMFSLNSLGAVGKSTVAYMGVAVFAMLVALWFRGKFWNYAIVIGLEGFLAIFIAMAFPVMEMILEAILNDKLKKVGDKVRAH